MKLIKVLRKQKNESQSDLADAIGVSLRTIQNYEKGSVSIPKKNLEKIAQHYDVTVSYLFKDPIDVGKFTVTEPLGFYQPKNGLNYEELPNGKWRVKVPRVPFKAYASFIEVADDEYQIWESFDETYFTVDHPGKGRYLAFIVANDSMNGGGINDTPDGAEALGRELQRHHWMDGFRDSEYGWIIITETGMMHKDLSGPDNKGMINCSSRNQSPEYPDFLYNLNEVHSIWKVIKRTF